MKSDKDLLAFYRAELRRSKRWREQNYDDDWRRCIDLYAGKHYDRLSGTDQLTVNLMFATKNVMAPAVALRNPRFTVNAQTPDDAPNAIITEEVLNYLWRTNKYQEELRLAVDDWIVMGNGWLKVGYKYVKPPERKEVDTDWNQVSPETQAEPEEGIDDREQVEGNVESEMIIEDDRPFVERLSPFDIYVDPDARHMKEIRWIAQRIWRPIADVHADSRYSATQRKRVSSSTFSKWSHDDGDGRAGGSNSFTRAQPDRGEIGYAEIIEFYDIKRGTLSVFPANGDPNESGKEAGFLIKPADMPYATGHPFVMLRNYEIPDHFYTLGDLSQIESLQLELNETRNQMLNFRKKYRRGYAYQKDALDQEGIQALESEVDNVAVPVRGDYNPANAIVPLPTVTTPPEFFDQSAMISEDIDRVSGVSDYQRGAQTAIKRTATEAAMIQDAANARAQDRLARVEEILSRVGERLVALMQQYMTGERVARITSIPVAGWVNYDEEYIQGNFDFEVVGGSTEPQNETFRRQSAMQMMDAMMPFMEMGVVNPQALMQHILQTGFGVKDPTKFLMGQQPEMAPGMEQMGQPPQEPPMPEMQLSPEDLAMMQGDIPPG